MVNYQELFELVSVSSHTLLDEWDRRIDALAQQNGSEEHLRRISKYLHQHYERHNPEPIIAETDANAIILSVNDAFCRISKYPREELVGNNINLLASSHTEPGVFTDLWNHISVGKPWIGELRNRAKDYETYAVEILIVPILDENGKPERYWSMAYDISERIAKQELLEAKNKEHHDSLQYAKRIQKAILPVNKSIDELFPDWFVMYRPKDLVSGDFYWFARSIRTAFIAVVDCTGHGAPGAFMSLIGFNLLNQIVNERKIYKPGEILTELHRGVRTTLRQDEEGSRSRDGMEVCLLAIDIYDDTFEYAGAMRPLYFWKDGELQEIKPDKLSIGGEQMEEERVFSTQELEFSDGDAVYMVSDGFVDQIGGPEQKKFSTKRLKGLIAENAKEDMKTQRALFNLVWKDWKADDEQLDDVTLLGIKFHD